MALPVTPDFLFTVNFTLYKVLKPLVVEGYVRAIC